MRSFGTKWSTSLLLANLNPPFVPHLQPGLFGHVCGLPLPKLKNICRFACGGILHPKTNLGVQKPTLNGVSERGF